MEVVSDVKLEIPEKYQEREEPPKNTRFVGSLLLPAIIIFAAAILFPIVIGIFISFTDSSASTGYLGENITLVNFWELLTYGNLTTRNFWQYTYQTLFFSVVSLIFEFILGIIFALILNKQFKGRGLVRATLLIPWAIPTVASATIFRFEIVNTAGDYGLINSIIQIFGGLPISFFGVDAPTLFYLPCVVPYEPFIIEIEITMTMFTAIMIDVWKTTPFITLLILAALQIVPHDLNKAGDIAGANGWQKFRYITWPLIKPGVGIALIFRMMQALRVYDAIVVFNDRSVRSMTSYAVDLWLSSEYGLASAISVMLLLFIILFAIIILIFTRRAKVQKTESEESVLDKTIEKIKGIVKKSKEGQNGESQIQREKPKEDSTEGYDLQEQQGIESVDLSQYVTKLEPISKSKVQWYKARRILKRIIFYLLVVFMCLFCAAPFIWIVIRSFRDPFITQTEFELFPKYLSLRAYQVIFESSDIYGVTFERALLNGFILSGLTVLVVVIVGSLIAYAIAKFDFKGKGILNGFIFSMNSLPPLIIIIPFYIQMVLVSTFVPILDLRDNLLGLVLPYAAFNLPLAVFILIAFFREIPKDLWSAAKVDGASNFQIFRKVILPLTIPGIFTVAILTFIMAWNELLFAQIFLTSPSNHTVPRAILRYVRNPQSLTAPWDTDIALMAATSLATIPLVIMVLIFQKKIISGLTQGAVKG
ncbi:MAG: ABC transporter permease subunit [Promethearchaeota archaeon]|nr:MAG: ABC transporter permease subunit [Candidatus Lokiarchaeota archaeon]